MAKINKIAVTVQLTEDVYKSIYDLAKVTGLSFSESIRLVLIANMSSINNIKNQFLKQ